MNQEIPGPSDADLQRLVLQKHLELLEETLREKRGWTSWLKTNVIPLLSLLLTAWLGPARTPEPPPPPPPPADTQPRPVPGNDLKLSPPDPIAFPPPGDLIEAKFKIEALNPLRDRSALRNVHVIVADAQKKLACGEDPLELEATLKAGLTKELGARKSLFSVVWAENPSARDKAVDVAGPPRVMHLDIPKPQPAADAAGETRVAREAEKPPETPPGRIG